MGLVTWASTVNGSSVDVTAYVAEMVVVVSITVIVNGTGADRLGAQRPPPSNTAVATYEPGRNGKVDGSCVTSNGSQSRTSCSA